MLMRIFAFLALLAVSLPVLAADSPAKPMTPELLKALQKEGGYTLYLRHGATDISRPDRVPTVNLEDCMTQRPLSDKGRQQSARIGKAIRALGIPLGEVLSSPFCRAKEMAELAFGAHKVAPALMASSNATDQEIAPLLKDFRALLGRAVPAGTNRMLVAHSTVLMDATGIFAKPEGVTLVFHADGKGGFELLAAVPPEEWERLAAAHTHR